jgi:hypothetical protein
MKLLLCLECQDVFKLHIQIKECVCGATQGQYLDKTNAWYSGRGIPLGLGNRSLQAAIIRRPDQGPGVNFTAFVIEEDCKTFIRKTYPPEQETFNYVDITMGMQSYKVTKIHGLWMRNIHGKWEYYDEKKKGWADYENIDNTVEEVYSEDWVDIEKIHNTLEGLLDGNKG